MNTTQAGEKLIRIVAFTLIISVMNGTMFNVALPTIGNEFRLSASQVSWVITVYVIVYAVGSVIYGKLADQFRLKDLITVGLVLFAAGSLLGFVASAYWMIIVGRLLQSAGASVIPATSMIIPIRYFSPETRGRALGITGTGLALGMALGPICAGFVTSVASWRYLFLLSVLATFTLPFYRKYLDNERGQANQADFLGGAMLTATIAAVLLSVSEGSWGLLTAGIVLLGCFVRHIHRVQNPFVHPGLFKNRSYIIGVAASFIAYGLSFSATFLLPQLLTQINGLSPLYVGFVMFPGALAATLFSRFGGRLADMKGNLFVVLIASGLYLTAFVPLSVVAGIQPSVIWIFLIFFNLGATFYNISLSNTVSRTLSREQTGVGMGLLTMFNFIAGAMATTFVGKSLDLFGSASPIVPVLLKPEAAVYSNIFVVLCLFVLMLAAMYYWHFRRRPTLPEQMGKLAGQGKSGIRQKSI
jgi:DHA2 family metal-tetracycline-proton antiporter-like MFS transporter